MKYDLMQSVRLNLAQVPNLTPRSHDQLKSLRGLVTAMHESVWGDFREVVWSDRTVTVIEARFLLPSTLCP